MRRVYEEPSAQDGTRVLVDRVWPRGLRKDALRLDDWAKDVAPSTELRTWYGHDTAVTSASWPGPRSAGCVPSPRPGGR